MNYEFLKRIFIDRLFVFIEQWKLLLLIVFDYDWFSLYGYYAVFDICCCVSDRLDGSSIIVN